MSLSVNIGNARLYGLEEDLNLEGDQYQIAVSLLFVTYILSEVIEASTCLNSLTDRCSFLRTSS